MTCLFIAYLANNGKFCRGFLWYTGGDNFMPSIHPSTIGLLTLIGVVTFGIVLLVIFDQPGLLKTSLVTEYQIIGEGEQCGEDAEEEDEQTEDAGGDTLSLAQRPQPQPVNPPARGYCSCLCSFDRWVKHRVPGYDPPVYRCTYEHVQLCQGGFAPSPPGTEFPRLEPPSYVRRDPPTQQYYCLNNWFHDVSTQRIPTPEDCDQLNWNPNYERLRQCSGWRFSGTQAIYENRGQYSSCVWVYPDSSPTPQQQQ
jgi:hypothetical protein